MATILIKLFSCAFDVAGEAIDGTIEMNKKFNEQEKLRRKKGSQRIYNSVIKNREIFADKLVEFVDDALKNDPELKEYLKTLHLQRIAVYLDNYTMKKSDIMINFDKTVNGKNWSVLIRRDLMSDSDFIKKHYLIACSSAIKHFPEKFDPKIDFFNFDNIIAEDKKDKKEREEKERKDKKEKEREDRAWEEKKR